MTADTAWYLGLRRQDVAPDAILVGDPARLDIYAEHLASVRRLAREREFASLAGEYAGRPVLVVAIGIGAPSLAIAVEELASLGVQRVARVGTTLARTAPLGSLVLAQAAVRLDGTSARYAPAFVPAVPDPELYAAFRDTLADQQAPWVEGVVASTDAFYAARLPRIAPPSQLNLSFVIALVVAVAAAVLIYRTTAGFALRAVGSNPRFARSAGIDVPATIMAAMVASGFIGGLGGAGQVLGVNYRFIQGFSPGYGFDGITVALLARNDPLGAIFGAVFFGALRNGGATIQLFADIPIDLIHVLQAAIILFVTVEPRLPEWYVRWRRRTSSAAGTVQAVRE